MLRSLLCSTVLFALSTTAASLAETSALTDSKSSSLVGNDSDNTLRQQR